MADDKKPDDKRTEDKKTEKKPDDLAPYPSQAEADEWKVRLAGPDARVEKREVKEMPEELPPTPTQAENDAAKLAAMPPEAPEIPPIDETGGTPGDGGEIIPPEARKTTEAGKPAGYSTRAVKPRE